MPKTDTLDTLDDDMKHSPNVLWKYFSSRRLPVATWAGLNVCAWDKYNDKYSVPCIAVRRTEADISGTDGFKQLVLDQS